MKTLSLLAVLTVLIFTSCASNPSSPIVPIASVRSYNGTASVGDFLTITLDGTAHTITYNDVSNSESGVVPYTVNSDGTYTLNDPSGNLIAAY